MTISWEVMHGLRASSEASWLLLEGTSSSHRKTGNDFQKQPGVTSSHVQEKLQRPYSLKSVNAGPAEKAHGCVYYSLLCSSLSLSSSPGRERSRNWRRPPIPEAVMSIGFLTGSQLLSTHEDSVGAKQQQQQQHFPLFLSREQCSP